MSVASSDSSNVLRVTGCPSLALLLGTDGDGRVLADRCPRRRVVPAHLPVAGEQQQPALARAVLFIQQPQTLTLQRVLRGLMVQPGHVRHDDAATGLID